MVKAFHAAGIEVDPRRRLQPHRRGRRPRPDLLASAAWTTSSTTCSTTHGRYLNFSGCGNTVNCNHPVVRDLIMTCLRYWVGDMHVDGFRFDLASASSAATAAGNVMVEPPVVESIAEDGVLADTKLIAEPWDAAGLYQVGGFPFGRRWSEWNGRYRDDVRRFWRGDAGLRRRAGDAALRQRRPVPVERPAAAALGQLRHLPRRLHAATTSSATTSKHNEANGEEQPRRRRTRTTRGTAASRARPTTRRCSRLRQRQAKNLMATLHAVARACR